MSSPKAVAKEPSLFRNRNYTMLYLGQLVSLFGDWFRGVVMIVVLYDLHPSASTVGGMFIATILPSLFGSIFVGPLVDRWNKKKIMIWTNLLRFVLTLGIVWGVYLADIWVIYGLMVISSIISAAFQPARTAVIPEIVQENQIVKATSSFAILNSVTMVVASALGGFVADWVGPYPIMLFDAFSYLFAAFCIWLMRYQPLQKEVKQRLPYWQQVKEGYDYVRATPQLVAVFWITAARDFVLGYVYILFAVFILEVVQTGNTGMGIGYSMTAVAYLIGAWLIRWYFKSKPFEESAFFKIFLPCHIIYGVGLGVMFSMTGWYWFLVALVVTYIFSQGVNIIAETSLMTYSRADNRGRVVASWLTASRLAYAISLPLFSVIGGYIPIAVGGYLLTAVCVISALCVYPWLKARLTSQMKEKTTLQA
ncbi:putative MFS family arabinose efflux permease [Tumebacillus sp. BK434]|uniref:MFS transporter n=1 Tax=Tumebacillus sp. BK434 TaxID=2512169 RepID=UPI001043F149|nr:MFS transporter [Tumebacillus sp. BK434]TCP55557.1 putative MFS family arabinose efflux permease [Tumebacillus sp. BK434]